MAVGLVFTNTLPGYRSWHYKKANDKIVEFDHEDNDGGQTPAETLDMFIDALEKADLELASKYFITEKQQSWLKILREYAENDLLDQLIKEIESTREKVTFQKYSNGTWKIKDF